jgi:hypothetical protein
MDLNSISYLTLKNGNMVLIDDSVPEKGNKEKMKLSKSSGSNKNESKKIQKNIKLEIVSPSSLYFKGIKIYNSHNNENDRRKHDYKIFNKIIKNENFLIKGMKANYFNNNNILEKEKENIPTSNINNHFNVDKTSKFSYQNENKMDSYSRSQIPKENEIPHVNFKFNNNNENNILSEYNQNKLNPNINTNMSIPITNSYNNNINNDNNNNDNQFNLNSNNSNYNQESKRRNKSKIFGFFGKDKKVRISINAVCSLNIKAEDKYKINLINQFNNLVDRLNEEREKDTVTKLLQTEKVDKYSKFYPFYKNKTHNDVIKKNFELMNQNYNLNNDFNSDINNNSIKNKTLNNFYKKENIIGYNNFINTNKNLALNQNMRKVNSPSSNDIEKLKSKIQRLSSGIVRPSNKMFKI